ncbi:MAG: DUF2267 domain-containing protein [Solirubrobacteraceae bacterium]
MMDYQAFMTIVGERVNASPGAPERAAQATLETLGERIDREEARQVAALLPPELAPWIATATSAERLDVDEFVRRVAEREQTDPVPATRHVAAVFDALARTIGEKEWNDIVSGLSRTFAPLLPRGPYVRVLDAGAFRERVATRAGLDGASADGAIQAVLETLGERIAGGEVDHLIEHLPIELHPPLKRGRDDVGGRAFPMTLDKFLQHVAEREGVSAVQAALHARAVFPVLRDAVGDRVFRDVMVQLPSDYVELLAR